MTCEVCAYPPPLEDCKVKFAVALLSLFIVNEQRPVPEHVPDQPLNAKPSAGETVSVMLVPEGYEDAQGLPLQEIEPEPFVETLSVGCDTERVNPVVLPSEEPETVIGYEPGLALPETERVKTLVAPAVVGLTEEGLKEVETPAGRPDAESVTDCEEPFVRVAVIVFPPDCPCVIERLPEFPSE